MWTSTKEKLNVRMPVFETKSKARRQRTKEIIHRAGIPDSIVGRILRVSYKNAASLDVLVQSRAVNGVTMTIILGIPANTVISRTKHHEGESAFLGAEEKEYIQAVSFLRFTDGKGWSMALDWGKESLPVSIVLT